MCASCSCRLVRLSVSQFTLSLDWSLDGRLDSTRLRYVSYFVYRTVVVLGFFVTYGLHTREAELFRLLLKHMFKFIGYTSWVPEAVSCRRRPLPAGGGGRRDGALLGPPSVAGIVERPPWVLIEVEEARLNIDGLFTTFPLKLVPRPLRPRCRENLRGCVAVLAAAVVAPN